MSGDAPTPPAIHVLIPPIPNPTHLRQRRIYALPQVTSAIPKATHTCPKVIHTCHKVSKIQVKVNTRSRAHVILRTNEQRTKKIKKKHILNTFSSLQSVRVCVMEGRRKDQMGMKKAFHQAIQRGSYRPTKVTEEDSAFTDEWQRPRLTLDRPIRNHSHYRCVIQP